MITINENETTYLYKLIEDYHDAESDGEKAAVVRDFCTLIWSSANKRRVYTKSIRFTVCKNRLDSQAGQIFKMWSDIEYKGYKSVTSETDYISYIRQKVNNLYTRYCDREVILQPEYMDLLKTPKRLYFAWLDGDEPDPAVLTAAIDDAIADSILMKERLQKEKMALSWGEYKQVAEQFFRRIFASSRLIDEYENTAGRASGLSTSLDCVTEDNFYIRYFCRSLDGLMKNYQKHYYKVRRGTKVRYFRCGECRILSEKVNNNQKYCPDCSQKRRRRYKTEMEKQRRIRMKELRGHSELLKKCL